MTLWFSWQILLLILVFSLFFIDGRKTSFFHMTLCSTTLDWVKNKSLFFQLQILILNKSFYLHSWSSLLLSLTIVNKRAPFVHNTTPHHIIPENLKEVFDFFLYYFLVNIKNSCILDCYFQFFLILSNSFFLYGSLFDLFSYYVKHVYSCCFEMTLFNFCICLWSTSI